MGVVANSLELLARDAKGAVERRDWSTVIASTKECLDVAPDHPAAFEWRGMLAKALLESGSYAEADAVFRLLVRGRPNSATGYIGIARTAHQNEQWASAAAAWHDCIERFPEHQEQYHWRNMLAASLLKQGCLDEAEQMLLRLTRDYPDRFQAFVALARIADARRDWAASQERWRACCLQFPQHPSKRSWSYKRAGAYMRRRAWQEAYELWTTLAREDISEPTVVVSRARCLLEWKGLTAESEQLAAEAIEQFPDHIPVLRLRLHVANLRHDHKAILALYRRWVELEPHSIEPYGHFMAAALRAADIAVAGEIVEKVPSTLRETIDFQCRVLLPYYELQGDFAAGLRAIESIDETLLDESSALAIARYLYAAARTEQLLTFMSSMVEKFPNTISFIKRYLFILNNACGVTKFEQEKARLFASLDDQQIGDVLSSLPTAWLSAEDVELTVRRLTSNGNTPQAEERLFALICGSDPKILDPLIRQLESEGSPTSRLATRLLRCTSRDRRRMETAGLTKVAWAEFAEEAAATTADVARLIDDADAAGQISSEAASAIRSVTRLSRRCSNAWMHTRESYWNAASFAAWLIERIRSGAPTSFVRLGDGEGNFLPYSPAVNGFMEADRRRIQQTWWGEERISSSAYDAVTAAFVASVSRADALGIPEPWLLLRDARALGSTTYGRGEANIVAFLDNLDTAILGSKVVVASKAHQDLEGWGLYRQIFAAVDAVSVISCHDLARTLAERFGVSVRSWYRVPPEQRYAGMFGSSNEGLIEPFFPNIFERMIGDIDPQPGEVFLVAAGFLGKLLCGRIQQRGGIALDIGAVADAWMGYKTRKEAIGELDFEPSISLIENQPFADAFDAASIARVEPCRSDHVRRHNLTEKFAHLFPEEQEKRLSNYALRLIGHPRCGSTFLARYMHRFGLSIGHERLAEDGLCNWMHAVDDLNLPYHAPALPAASFRNTLAYVRDPATAIPSIMLENCVTTSFAFRRFHVARRLGVDIARRSDPLERAVESLVLWMEIVEQEHPLFTIRVERAAEDWEAHADVLATTDLWRNTPASNSNVELPRDLNASAHKFSLPKPEIDPIRYDNLPMDLLERLAAFCRRYDYPFPGSIEPT